MTTLREAAQQALEALEYGPDVDPIFAGETEDALRAALAQEQPEPVCKCDLRTRLVGDGCEICNPELAAQLAKEQADGRVVIERRDDMLYMNGSEIGPGTLEIRRDGVTYRAAERVAVQQPEPAQEPDGVTIAS